MRGYPLGAFSTLKLTRNHAYAQEETFMTHDIHEIKNGRKIIHRIDLSQVDQIDERSGDEQLALVWCENHRSFEWHWVDLDHLG
jgi:hypothetical protein